MRYCYINQAKEQQLYKQLVDSKKGVLFPPDHLGEYNEIIPRTSSISSSQKQPKKSSVNAPKEGRSQIKQNI